MKKNKSFYLITIIIIILIIIINFNSYDKLNNIMWAIASALIIMGGLFWSKKLNFAQLNFKEMFKALKNDKKNSQDISTFESLSLSLGARVGVGSLAGIALAIYIGGPGTIFWIWIITFISSSNTFVESLLGVVYRKKDKSNINLGGPSYYIKNGLGYKKLAIIYSLLIIMAYIIGFLTIQSNTIVKSVTNIINVNPIIITIFLTIITFLIIMNGTKKIANISAKIVPLMTIIYIVMGMVIILSNITIIPNILLDIFKSAWTSNGIKGGVFSVMIIGIQRGIFSNESGIGTSVLLPL